jgi:hypothetical protein
MTLSNGHYEKQRSPVRSLAHDLRPTRVQHLVVTRKPRNARTSSSARCAPWIPDRSR